MNGITWTLRHRLPKDGYREQDADGRVFVYRAEQAARAVAWWEKYIRIPDGPLYARPFLLRTRDGKRVVDWQYRIWCALNGWRRLEDGGPRFRRFTFITARGNTKSSFGAGVGLHGLVGQPRPTARVVGAGTDKRNASEIYTYASRMVRLERRLLRHARPLDGTKRIIRRNRTGLYEIIASEPGRAHGTHATTLLVDDLQAHPRDEFVRVLRSGQSENPDPDQPAIPDPFEADFMSAGSNREGIGYQEWSTGQELLDMPGLDSTRLVYIAAADPKDDIEDESVWIKANPNLGVSVSRTFLRERVREAKTKPSELNDVLRYQFTIWTDAETAKYTLDQWRGLGGGLITAEDLRGRECWVGMDLSQSQDLTAVAYFFPPTAKEPGVLYLRHFIPGANVGARVEHDRVPYDRWIREGWLTPTEGEVIDEEAIEADILKHAALFRIRRVAFDRWHARGVVVKLDKARIELEPFGQGYESMGPAMKAFDRLVYGRRFVHGGNPLLAWEARNLVTVKDEAENEKPSKRRARERVDGMVAAIMAVGAWDRVMNPLGEGPSAYEARGLRTVG